MGTVHLTETAPLEPPLTETALLELQPSPSAAPLFQEDQLNLLAVLHTQVVLNLERRRLPMAAMEIMVLQE